MKIEETQKEMNRRKLTYSETVKGYESAKERHDRIFWARLAVEAAERELTDVHDNYQKAVKPARNNARKARAELRKALE